jgi:hypothetical protein
MQGEAVVLDQDRLRRQLETFDQFRDRFRAPTFFFLAVEYNGHPPSPSLRRDKCAKKDLIPIFPDRIEPAATQHLRDFSRRSFVANFKLPRR